MPLTALTFQAEAVIGHSLHDSRQHINTNLQARLPNNIPETLLNATAASGMQKWKREKKKKKTKKRQRYIASYIQHPPLNEITKQFDPALSPSHTHAPERAGGPRECLSPAPSPGLLCGHPQTPARITNERRHP